MWTGATQIWSSVGVTWGGGDNGKEEKVVVGGVDRAGWGERDELEREVWQRGDAEAGVATLRVGWLVGELGRGMTTGGGRMDGVGVSGDR